MIPQDNQARIAHHVAGIIEALGYDLKDPHFRDTPIRVARAYSDILDGNFRDLGALKAKLTAFEDASYHGTVVVTRTPFYAFCAHHMALFRGQFAIGYKPKNGRQLGLSKLVRIFRHGCRHLTTQEVVTQRAANLLAEAAGTPDTICYAIAEHTCMSCRGVQSHETGTVTVACAQGSIFDVDPNERNHFLSEARRCSI